MTDYGMIQTYYSTTNSDPSSDNYAYFTNMSGAYSGTYILYAWGTNVQHYSTGQIGVSNYGTTDSSTLNTTINQLISGGGTSVSLFADGFGGINLKFGAGSDSGNYPTNCSLTLIVAGPQLHNVTWSEWGSG